jgi:hypothetical protein
LRGLLFCVGPRLLERAPHRAHQLSQGVHDRVAVLRADLQQHVAVRDAGVELIDRERRHLGQLARALAGQPVAMVEQRRPQPDRDRQRVGRVVWPERP